MWQGERKVTTPHRPRCLLWHSTCPTAFPLQFHRQNVFPQLVCVASRPWVCCAGFVSRVSSRYPTVFTDTFNINAASKHVSRHICSSEALGFPRRVRCCISSSTLTLLRVDGDGGWAIKVIKWPLSRCLSLSHFHSLCPRWLRLPFLRFLFASFFFCFPPP